MTKSYTDHVKGVYELIVPEKLMDLPCHALPCGGELVAVHGWGQILPSSVVVASSRRVVASAGAKKGTPSCNAGVRDLGFSLREQQKQTKTIFGIECT